VQHGVSAPKFIFETAWRS